MPKNNTINSIHAQRLKQIRGFINFDYDLRKPLKKHQKAKIKKYYDEIEALTARPFQVYRPKSKANLKKAQQFAQHEKQLPGLKVAFIPTDGKNKARVRFSKKGEIAVSSDHVTTRIVSLDPNQLLKNPAEYVKRRIRNRKEKSYTVLAGRYEIPVGLNKATVPDYVARLTAKYGETDANNYFGNWLKGLAAHSFENQSTFAVYLNEKQKNKKQLQRKRRNKKQREYRRKNK